MQQLGDLSHSHGAFAGHAARRIVPLLTSVLSVGSVADFGCGRGAWLKVWQEAGADIVGVDRAGGEPLMIEPGAFRAGDPGKQIDLGRRFDLVQSRDAAAGVAPAQAGQFVDNLVAHATQVLFSTARLETWRRLFRERGYVAIDYLRPVIHADHHVPTCYRWGMLLYVREDRAAALPFPVRARRVPDRAALADYRPLGDRLRHAVSRLLPAGQPARPRAEMAARPA